MGNIIDLNTALQDNDRFKELTLKEIIELYFEKLKENNGNTAKNYRSYLNSFFNKEVSELTWEEILKVTPNHVDRYNLSRSRQGYAPTYLNQFRSCILGFYKMLQAHHPSVSEQQVRTTPFKDPLNEERQWGALTIEEFNSLLSYIAEFEKVKSKEKRLIFLTLYLTAHRVEAVLDIDRTKFIDVVDKNTGERIKVLRLYDKTKLHNTPIPIDFYNELMSLFKTNDPYEKCFTLSVRTIERVMQRWAEYVGIEEWRNITVHSIKKLVVDICLDTTGNYKLTANHTKHSVKTLVERYAGKNERLLDSPSFFLLDALDGTVKPINRLSKQDLIEILNQIDDSLIDKIVAIAKEQGRFDKTNEKL